jgi:hypothetical protein
MNETSARHTFAMLGQTTADLFAALQIKRGRMIDGIFEHRQDIAKYRDHCNQSSMTFRFSRIALQDAGAKSTPKRNLGRFWIYGIDIARSS